MTSVDSARRLVEENEEDVERGLQSSSGVTITYKVTATNQAVGISSAATAYSSLTSALSAAVTGSTLQSALASSGVPATVVQSSPVFSAAQVQVLHSAGPTGSPSSMPTVMLCGAGYYHAPHGDGPICIQCPGGKFSHFNSTSCLDCAVGYALNSPSDRCNMCEPGSISYRPGTAVCHGCLWPSTTVFEGKTTCDAFTFQTNLSGLGIFAGLAVVLYCVCLLRAKSRAEAIAFTFLPACNIWMTIIYLMSGLFFDPWLFTACIVFAIAPCAAFLRLLSDYNALMPGIIFAKPRFLRRKELLFLSYGYGFYPLFKGKQLKYHFKMHDTLFKLFWYWLSWASILTSQMFALSLWLMASALHFMIHAPLWFLCFISGCYLYQSKAMAVGEVFEIWIRVWTWRFKTGEAWERDIVAAEGKVARIQADIAAELVVADAALLAAQVIRDIQQKISDIKVKEMTANAHDLKELEDQISVLKKEMADAKVASAEVASAEKDLKNSRKKILTLENRLAEAQAILTEIVEAFKEHLAMEKIFSVKVDFDTAMLNESLLYELFLQSIPQVGVQLTNNWINNNVMKLFNLVSVGMAFIMALLELSRCIAYAFSSVGDKSSKSTSFRDWPMEFFCLSLKPADHRALTQGLRAQALAAMPAREPCWPHWYTPPAKEVEGKVYDEEEKEYEVLVEIDEFGNEVELGIISTRDHEPSNGNYALPPLAPKPRSSIRPEVPGNPRRQPPRAWIRSRYGNQPEAGTLHQENNCISAAGQILSFGGALGILGVLPNPQGQQQIAREAPRRWDTHGFDSDNGSSSSSESGVSDFHDGSSSSSSGSSSIVRDFDSSSSSSSDGDYALHLFLEQFELNDEEGLSRALEATDAAWKARGHAPKSTDSKDRDTASFNLVTAQLDSLSKQLSGALSLQQWDETKRLRQAIAGKRSELDFIIERLKGPCEATEEFAPPNLAQPPKLSLIHI